MSFDTSPTRIRYGLRVTMSTIIYRTDDADPTYDQVIASVLSGPIEPSDVTVEDVKPVWVRK